MVVMALEFYLKVSQKHFLFVFFIFNFIQNKGKFLKMFYPTIAFQYLQNITF